MTDYETLLNKAQLEAVTTSNQYVRIIAGAGSGKTRVLTYRIAYLIEHFNVNPSSILAVTFTNKAANEMKERVIKLLPGCSSYLSVSTFHSFCAKFLRREAYLLGYPASFAILDDEDTEKIIKDIAANRGLKKSDPLVKQAIRVIEHYKRNGTYPDQVNLPSYASDIDKEILEIYKLYEEKKAEMFALDFDDLLLYTIAILKQFNEVRDAWSYRFKHILIDEFQDTNNVQYELIKLLVNENTNLYVVGDPDQTIYTWRGANQDIILNFPTDFSPAIDIVLSRNYRSTKNILDASNRLIGHNKYRVKKDLYTESEDGTTIEGKRFDDINKEACFVARKIVGLHEKGAKYKDIAVLYRASYFTRSFEQELTRQKIPYKIFGGLRFYQRKEVKDALAFFKLMLNSKDDLSFDRIINVPRRGIGPTAIERITDLAFEEHLSKYEVCLNQELLASLDISTTARNSINSFVMKMEETKKKLADNSEAYSAILREFLIDLGFFTYLAEDEDANEDRVGNVNELFSDINAFITQFPDSHFDEYLQNISLLTSQDDIDGGDYVCLMTIHVAKGLEFDNVFIICMNEGAFPSERTLLESGNKGLEEERRLAYVAMTRAKKKLFLTTNSSYSFQTDSHSSPSRFFKEAGVVAVDETSGFTTKPGGLVWKSKPIYPSKSRSDEEEKVVIKPARDIEVPKTNGITDWKVGDKVNHETFGIGYVEKILSEGIIIVNFENSGKKTLISSHPKLTRICSSGGEA